MLCSPLNVRKSYLVFTVWPLVVPTTTIRTENVITTCKQSKASRMAPENEAERPPPLWVSRPTRECAANIFCRQTMKGRVFSEMALSPLCNHQFWRRQQYPAYLTFHFIGFVLPMHPVQTALWKKPLVKRDTETDQLNVPGSRLGR